MKRLHLAALASLAIMVVSGPVLALDPYDVPVITCDDATGASITLKVCGGATGAPAGVSIHWTTLADYELNGWGGAICALSLSGQPSLQHPGKSRWELLPGECETITIGDINFDETGVSGNDCAYNPLECGTEYVFRIFAHAGRGFGRSAFSGPLTCSTDDCSGGGACTYTQGFWKTHGPDGCRTGNNDNEWPLPTLTLGVRSYTQAELCLIYGTPAGGNGLIALAHQLIAAKLNVANYPSDAVCAEVLADIAAADALIGTKVVPPIGAGSLSNSATSALRGALTAFNEGERCGRGHCGDEVLPSAGRLGLQGSSAAPSPTESSSWGQVKADYR